MAFFKNKAVKRGEQEEQRKRAQLAAKAAAQEAESRQRVANAARQINRIQAIESAIGLKRLEFANPRQFQNQNQRQYARILGFSDNTVTTKQVKGCEYDIIAQVGLLKKRKRLIKNNFEKTLSTMTPAQQEQVRKTAKAIANKKHPQQIVEELDSVIRKLEKEQKNKKLA